MTSVSSDVRVRESEINRDKATTDNENQTREGKSRAREHTPDAVRPQPQSTESIPI